MPKIRKEQLTNCSRAPSHPSTRSINHERGGDIEIFPLSNFQRLSHPTFKGCSSFMALNWPQLSSRYRPSLESLGAILRQERCPPPPRNVSLLPRQTQIHLFHDNAVPPGLYRLPAHGHSGIDVRLARRCRRVSRPLLASVANRWDSRDMLNLSTRGVKIKAW